MSTRVHVLRAPAHRRSATDPLSAILPEVAEAKLDTTLCDDQENPVPLRTAKPTQDEPKRWSLRNLFRAVAPKR